MASYIVKAKGLNINDSKARKVTIGRFYSGDRFYTLLNEYIDKNLSKKNKFMAWIIKVLFKSSNFKHDPGIANGQPLSVKLFDWLCILCLIVAIALSLSTIVVLIPWILQKVGIMKENVVSSDDLKNALLGVGIIALVFWIPAILWLIIFFTIRKKNKPLSLQAYVEKKISWCLMLRFLIKNSRNFTEEKNPEIIVLENFEAQGASGPRWLNLQMINLICSCFPEFNYTFKFQDLSDDDYNELKPIAEYDFRKIDIIKADEINWNKWEDKERKSLFKSSKNKTQEIETKTKSKQETKIEEPKKEETQK